MKMMDQMNSQFDKVNQRLDKLDTKMDKLEKRIDSLELSVGNVESRIDDVEVGVGSLGIKVSNIENQQMKHRVETSIQYEMLQESIGNVTIELRNGFIQISKVTAENRAVLELVQLRIS